MLQAELPCANRGGTEGKGSFNPMKTRGIAAEAVPVAGVVRGNLSPLSHAGTARGTTAKR